MGHDQAVQGVRDWAPDQPGPAWVELFRPLRAELVALRTEPKTPYLEEKAATYLKAVG